MYHVSHFQMAGIYVGCHTFHSGLVYDVVDAATVDIKLWIVANKYYETSHQNMSHAAKREMVHAH